MSTPKIHPEDVHTLINRRGTQMMLVRYKKPWWAIFIPGFMGPYTGYITIDGIEYEESIDAPRCSDCR